MRSIFYASSKRKATEFFTELKQRWEKNLPSAVKGLSNSIDACLTFFNCPEEEWISLPTSNIIERLNKEFKRRTKPMEYSSRGKGLLHASGFYLLKDGTAFEVKPYRKSAQEPAVP